MRQGKVRVFLPNEVKSFSAVSIEEKEDTYILTTKDNVTFSVPKNCSIVEWDKQPNMQQVFEGAS